MPFVVGETIGPYRIMEQLGRGGMATVFKAYHAALDRYVALKALHPAFMEDPNFHARFQREARVVAKLEHPNIVPIYDFAEYENRPYLVMKYIEGDTLKARMSAGPLERDEMIRIVESVGAGLGYAHAQGILHRDIKPSNVLLGNDGRIYLADFGLARIAQAGESTLSSDMMLGTPQYISPEQAMGLGELDERTDIYSFGVMLYELAVGKVPFSADTPFSIIHDHIYTPLPLPSMTNPDVSPEVERVLLKALSKERDDRYPDAASLADAFVQALSTQAEIAPVEVVALPEETPAPEIETTPEEASPVAEAVSAVIAEVSPQAALDEPEIPAQAPATGKAHRRFRWWFVPVGLVLLASCCFCSVFAYNVSVNRQAQVGEVSNDVVPTKPPGEQPLPPGEYPDDAYASFNQALLSWDRGDDGQAREALNLALDLAGDDPDFHYQAAQQLTERELWVDAAHVYLLAFQRFSPGKVPPEYVDSFHEAVYWAAESPDAQEGIPIPGIAKVDPPMEQVARARYLFYFEDEDLAYNLTDQILMEIKPDMPEALYLQAEFLYQWGDTETSFDILRELQPRPDTPDWIRRDIDLLLADANLMVENAQAQVDANPDDPYVYLPLYEVYLGQGQYDLAQAIIQQALQVAGEDAEFAQIAGDVAARNGFWLDAARLYARSGQLTPGEVRPDLAENILQALYYGAVEEGAPEVFGELESSLPDDNQGLLRGVYHDALMARYKLYYEDTFDAQALIDSAVERAPNLPLPRLIQAEIYQWNGDFEGSQAILLDLQQSRLLSPWMREEANWLLEEIQP